MQGYTNQALDCLK